MTYTEQQHAYAEQRRMKALNESDVWLAVDVSFEEYQAQKPARKPAQKPEGQKSEHKPN